VVIGTGIEAIGPASYPTLQWLEGIIITLDEHCEKRNAYDEQLQDLSNLLGWKRSDREKKNLLKYDGEKNDFLGAVNKFLHLYYYHMDPLVVRFSLQMINPAVQAANTAQCPNIVCETK
jgi:hypothetical protein